jgi:hypothetical protein
VGLKRFYDKEGLIAMKKTSCESAPESAQYALAQEAFSNAI